MSYPKRCLVLGGRGFIGSHLVDVLLSKGFNVRCFERPHVEPLGESHLSNPFFELFEGDLFSESDVAECVEGCDICFHLVSTTLPKTSNVDPVFDIESNVLGTVRLLTRAVKAGVKKVIFVSSGGTIYGVPMQVPIPETHPTDPICSYGISKLTIEKYLGLFKHLNGLDFIALRIANPFGGRQRTYANQGAVAVFLSKTLRGEEIEIWGDGSVVRDYVYIDDVVSALVASIDYVGDMRVFNIGSGRGLSINDVLDSIELVTSRKTTRRYVASRSFDVPANVLCIERAKHLLGWSPNVGFETGIRHFMQWLQRTSSY